MEPSALDLKLGAISGVVYVSLQQMREVEDAGDTCDMLNRVWKEVQTLARKAERYEKALQELSTHPAGAGHIARTALQLQ